MTTQMNDRRSGMGLLVTGLLVLVGAAVVFFAMEKAFPMWLILVAIAATFTSIGAGMLLDGRND